MALVELRIQIFVFQMIMAKNVLISFLDGIILKIIKLLTNKLSQMEIKEHIVTLKMVLIVY
jgi:hypothetical protein